MNKGLEILKDIKERLVDMLVYVTERNNTLRIKYCLKTTEDFERYVDNIIGIKTIEKDLKALEIIRRDTHILNDENGERIIIPFYDIYTPKEEYDLLKEVLL